MVYFLNFMTVDMLKKLDGNQMTLGVVNQRNIFKETPLHIAARKNKYEAVEWLFEHGADVSIRNHAGDLAGEDLMSDDRTKQLFRNHANKYGNSKK